MSNENQNDRSNGESNKPTHVVKQREGYGKKASYERIGVAWENDEDGSLYIRGFVPTKVRNPPQEFSY